MEPVCAIYSNLILTQMSLFFELSFQKLITMFIICLADIVDTVLEEDDIDNDGYLTYAEYVLARKREEAKRDEEARKNPNKDRQTL